MSEDRIREIVREEIAIAIAAVERERRVADIAAADQFKAELLAQAAPKEDDGPVVSRIKAILRGEQA